MATVTQPGPKVYLQPPETMRVIDHTHLPDSDGAMVENFQEHPQSILLTGSIWPVLEKRHPNQQFAIGQNSGIYYRVTEPPLDGCKAPDWYYIPGVPATLDGVVRRSYVLWREMIRPLIVIEFVSGDGSEERDRTPGSGKFWVYENAICAPYYAIYEVNPGRVEVHHLTDGTYVQMTPNEHGRYRIEPLGLELGIWHGTFMNLPLPWLRWWDAQGRLLPSAEERAALEEQRAEQEKQRAEREKQLAERLAAKLRALGVDPDQP
jgi:Uma2 family endonuclease